MKKIGIYKITSPKGRIYIGQSTNIVKRFAYYEKGYCKGQPRLLNSLKKYGYSNHDFSIIEECCVERLNEKERYWQEFYKVLGKKGLNCLYTTVGDCVYHGTLSHMKKRRKAYKKKVLSKEHKKKIALSWLTRKVSDETRKKQSLAHMGKSKSVSHRNNISKGRRGIKFSEASIQKMRKPKSPEHVMKIRAIIEKRKKPVIQLDQAGIIIKEWQSSSDASKALNIATQNIVRACKNNINAGGYKWCYKII